MEIIARYIHGSEDSIDTDVIYIVNELPDKGECKKWCSEDPLENRNLATIVDGHIDKVYKGSPDEVNNALLRTYPCHKQEYPLLITGKVNRNLEIKVIRSMRMILSHLSRTEMRPSIKAALHSDWMLRKKVLQEIAENWYNITINDRGHNMSAKDIMKVVAFQLGQTIALIEGEELYTKYNISQRFPYLQPYLYREDEALHRNNSGLETGMWRYLYLIETTPSLEVDYNVTGTQEQPLVKFVNSGNVYDLITETLIN